MSEREKNAKVRAAVVPTGISAQAGTEVRQEPGPTLEGTSEFTTARPTAQSADADAAMAEIKREDEQAAGELYDRYTLEASEKMPDGNTPPGFIGWSHFRANPANSVYSDAWLILGHMLAMEKRESSALQKHSDTLELQLKQSESKVTALEKSAENFKKGFDEQALVLEKLHELFPLEKGGAPGGLVAHVANVKAIALAKVAQGERVMNKADKLRSRPSAIILPGTDQRIVLARVAAYNPGHDHVIMFDSPGSKVGAWEVPGKIDGKTLSDAERKVVRDDALAMIDAIFVAVEV